MGPSFQPPTGTTQTPGASWAAVKRELLVHRSVLGSALALMWGAFAVDTVTGHALRGMGIHPRSIQGLWGILAAPFLHGSLAHIGANTASFLVLGWMVMLRGVGRFMGVTVVGTFTAGAVAWLLGAPGSVHIGASGVIFAYLGFLLSAGFFERRLATILVSVAVAAMWGGLVFGVLPGQPGISWECHLGGFLGGILAARRGAVAARKGS